MSERRPDLVPVHGGLAEPVDRIVPLKERKEFLAEAQALPQLRVTTADVSTVHRLADGTLSPLEGPMKSEAYHLALDEKVVVSNGKRYAWGIPLALPATDEESASFKAGGSVAVVQEDGRVVAIVDDVEVFGWDKEKYNQKVYLTDRWDHPGGRSVQNDSRVKLVGGAIRALPQVHHEEYGETMPASDQYRAICRTCWRSSLGPASSSNSPASSSMSAELEPPLPVGTG